MQQKQSLDTLAKVFGFPTSKIEMDGSMVGIIFSKEELKISANIALKDVELTRQVTTNGF